jgi:hypothetical protein
MIAKDKVGTEGMITYVDRWDRKLTFKDRWALWN